MNTTTPYEKLIAAKLDEIPVPDMADSIWSGIEMQLDAVAETPGKKPSPKYRGKGWYGFIAITAVVILLSLLWWHYYHKSHTPKNTAPSIKTLPSPKKSSPVKDSNKLKSDIKKNNTRQAVPIPTEVAPITTEKDTLHLNELPAIDTGFDSVPKQSLPPVNMDSSSSQNNRIVLPAVDSATIKLPGKKHKGVKGITSEDYRLSTRKDSTKKRN